MKHLTHSVLAFRGVSLTHPVVTRFFFFLSFLVWVESHVGFLFCWIYFFFFFFHFFFLFIFCFVFQSLLYPVLASFLFGEFFLNVPCSLHFYAGSFSYTSQADFVFMWGVSLTHPMLPSFLCGEFLLHKPCWLPFLFFF